jgi:hypothetical protein
LEQETFQSTPRFWLSFVTFATTLAVAFVTIVAGGAPAPLANAIETEAIGLTMRLVVTICEVSATGEALIVTFKGEVMPVGAVYVAATPLGVCCVIRPQLEEAHSTDQFTPRLFGSPVTFAVTCVVLPAASGEAGKPVIVMETLLTIVTVTVTLSDGDAVERALRFTVLPVGTELGAVKTVPTPLAV